MRKLMTMAAMLVALVVPASASDSIPAKFVGDWCSSAADGASPRYKRGRCKDESNEKGLAVRAKSLEMHEVYCDVFHLKRVGGGDYLVRARCWNEDQKFSENYLLAIDRSELVLR